MKQFTTMIILLALTSGVIRQANAEEKFQIKFEKYTLSNGLDVVLHQDKSDPVVAIALQYHVGSSREVPGKTGFAHLFEHMMFQESENVPQDQFFRKIQNAGGTLNGSTSKDGTNYYQVVPKNAMEMVLWMESDRMGYLINTVTQAAFANQQNVVQNEKRQNYDNRPYGHASYVMDKNFYPNGHPYSWQVIGSMEDLFNATIDDVKEFHAKFYVPNNATLVIAGDFETADVKKVVAKYFEEIPKGDALPRREPLPVTIGKTKKLYHEDNFATTPQLTMAWPTVESYHPDSYALNFLGQILSSGKKAPMYKVLVRDKQLTSRVGVFNSTMELGGRFQISVNANSKVSLAEVEKAIFEGFELFEKEGIAENDLERIKAGMETSFYNQLSSVYTLAIQLARYNEFAGDPGQAVNELAAIQAVTADDIKRVYNKYIRNKNYIATSFVPKGQVSLVAENSIKADVVEESITEALEVVVTETEEKTEIVKSPSLIDRSSEPAHGPDPMITLPKVWTSKLKNGIGVWGVKNSELPLVQYNLVIEGGHLLDPLEKSGVASFLAGMMTEGTKNRTPEELEEVIELLGARISVNAGMENITISVNTLARNFEKTMKIVEEILLEPRWDEEQFNLIKMSTLNNLKRNQANPTWLASSAFRKLLYGDGHILATETSGTAETVANITMDDLKAYYSRNISPSVTRMHVAGDIDSKQVTKASSSLVARWKPVTVNMPDIKTPVPPAEPKIYFVDIPGAKQSVIQIGGAAMPQSSPDYFAATVVNDKLGGSFNGFLNLILREEKGFTYGARSSFSGGRNFGEFSASSSVRSTATLESVEIFKTQIENYVNGISEEDLQFVKNSRIKSNARAFETLGSLLGMLNSISAYKKPADYVKQEEKFIRGLTVEEHTRLAQKYIRPQSLYYVIAGDAETQLKELEKAGLGTPVLLN
jgi:zinc protease